MSLPRPRVRPGRVAVGLAVVAGSAALGLGLGLGGTDGGPTDGSSEHWDAPAYVAAVDEAQAAADQARHERERPVAPAAPTPTVPGPTTYGDDPVLDDLWRQCEAGSGAACDQLFAQAPLHSGYEAFGLSCGNRPDVLHCTDLDAPPPTVPPPTLPPTTLPPTTAPPTSG